MLPTPGVLWTDTVPPCARTIERTMLSPSPKPSCVRDSRWSDW